MTEKKTALVKRDIRKSENIIDHKKLTKNCKNTDELFLFKCPNKIKKRLPVPRTISCNNIHYRHAGYVEMMIPHKIAKKPGTIARSSLQVMVCTKCKTPYVFHEGTFYNIKEHIDVKAWEKAEKELNKMTGPGGEC